MARKRESAVPTLAIDWQEETDNAHPDARRLKRWGKVGDARVDFMCAFEERGERVCRQYGTLSHTTQGAGPFYCREHFR